MQKSKLIQYLSQLSKKELKLFKEFVHSPYFNKHQKTIDLIDYIAEINDYSSPKLELQNVFQFLFPKQKYNPQLVRTVMSYLTQLIYRFYGQLHFEISIGDQQINLLEKALQDGQQKMFAHQSLIWEKSNTSTKQGDTNFFLQESKFHRLQDSYDINYGKRASGIHLEKALTSFDKYYLSEKLKLTCEMLARKQVTGQQYTFPLLTEIVEYLEKDGNHFEDIPEVWDYYLIFKMFRTDDSKYYFQLKSRLQNDAKLFRHQEGRDLYTHALNYCISKLNFGQASFKKETFELYQQMLNIGLLYTDQVLPQWDYTNIVKLGCDLQEDEWTKSFIYEQKEFLSKTDRENTFTYNLAVYHHAQGDHGQAQSLLQKVEFTEVYNNLLTRILLLKIYFETEDWNALEYFSDAFRLYLLRNKNIGDARRKSVLSLIRYTRSLSRLLEKRSIYSEDIFKNKLIKLKEKISNNDKVVNKNWLLSTIKVTSN